MICDTLPSAPAVVLPTTTACGADSKCHRRVFGLALRDFIDEDHDLARIVRLLRTERQRLAPSGSSRILEIADREPRERRGPVHKPRAQREHHELRRIVADVDDQPLRALGAVDVVGDLRGLHG